MLLLGLLGGSRILGLTFQQMMYNLSDKSNFREIVFLRGFRTLNIGQMFFGFTTHVLEDVKQGFWLIFRWRKIGHFCSHELCLLSVREVEFLLWSAKPPRGGVRVGGFLSQVKCAEPNPIAVRDDLDPPQFRCARLFYAIWQLLWCPKFSAQDAIFGTMQNYMVLHPFPNISFFKS
jgi:hypothetical protein